ncbi:membrane hypothetical protein [Gammaproteobacteria bacterium]
MFRSVLTIATCLFLLLASPLTLSDSPDSPGAGAEVMSPEVKASFGCMLLGTTATVATAMIGAENLVNLVAGGAVAPSNSAVLVIGVVGVVFSSFCTIGQVLTPSVLYMINKMGSNP